MGMTLPDFKTNMSGNKLEINNSFTQKICENWWGGVGSCSKCLTFCGICNDIGAV